MHSSDTKRARSFSLAVERITGGKTRETRRRFEAQGVGSPLDAEATLVDGHGCLVGGHEVHCKEHGALDACCAKEEGGGRGQG